MKELKKHAYEFFMRNINTLAFDLIPSLIYLSTNIKKTTEMIYKMGIDQGYICYSQRVVSS